MPRLDPKPKDNDFIHPFFSLARSPEVQQVVLHVELPRAEAPVPVRPREGRLQEQRRGAAVAGGGGGRRRRAGGGGRRLWWGWCGGCWWRWATRCGGGNAVKQDACARRSVDRDVTCSHAYSSPTRSSGSRASGPRGAGGWKLDGAPSTIPSGTATRRQVRFNVTWCE